MKKKLFLSIMFAGVAILLVGRSAMAHPLVVLRDKNGIAVDGGTNPYSPKVTCGVVDCHQVMADGAYPADQPQMDNLYESHWNTAVKSHVNRNGEIQSYSVPYPEHGVTTSYHVQMGRNDSWNDTQRDYYDLEEFTSSSGHYGRY